MLTNHQKFPFGRKFLNSACSRLVTYSKMEVFDREFKSLQRNAASRLANSEEFDYLKKEISKILIDRLDDIATSYKFKRVVDLGSGPGYNLERLQNRDIESLYYVEMAKDMLFRDEKKDDQYPLKPVRIHCSEEDLQSVFPEKSVDLFISNLSLHWVNDLPSTFAQIKKCLADDGVFIAAMFGEGTLLELRNSFILAEAERQNGVSPRISPFATVQDIGNLLSQVGFNLTTIDSEEYTIQYENPFILMHDLRGMAENNANVLRRKFLSRDTLFSAAAIYDTLYKDPETGVVPATFQVIYLIGWSPHESQQKPKERGSANVSMKTALKDDQSKLE